MRLSSEEAIIPEEKLCDYLLSPTHPDGRGKALYLARLGYDAAHWKRLEKDLRTQHLTCPANPGRQSQYGQKYEILGSLSGPNGARGWLRSIWIVRPGESAPRLVTVIPEEK